MKNQKDEITNGIKGYNSQSKWSRPELSHAIDIFPQYTVREAGKK